MSITRKFPVKVLASTGQGMCKAGPLTPSSTPCCDSHVCSHLSGCLMEQKEFFLTGYLCFAHVKQVMHLLEDVWLGISFAAFFFLCNNLNFQWPNICVLEMNWVPTTDLNRFCLYGIGAPIKVFCFVLLRKLIPGIDNLISVNVKDMANTELFLFIH